MAWVATPTCGRPGLPDPVDQVVELDGRDATVVRAAVVVRLEHRGRPRSERAVREQLEQPDAQPVAAEAGREAGLGGAHRPPRVIAGRDPQP